MTNHRKCRVVGKRLSRSVTVTCARVLPSWRDARRALEREAGGAGSSYERVG